ncbi:MAG: Fic family protein [Solirubrobacteraceae bacterium]
MAFVPDEIADYDPQLSGSTSTLVTMAEVQTRDLNQRDPSPTSFEGLARQLLRSEALASSWIEGLAISHRKLAEVAVSEHGLHRAKEVLANMYAMERAVEISSIHRPVNVDDIKDIHRELALVGSLARIAGQFREEQGWIGGASPVEAEYVPPPWQEVGRLMDDLCAFVNRDDLPAVAQAAIAHAQFETIHPFGDGNGRVGRALIHVILRRRGVAPNYVPPVSLVLGANKDAYIAGLRNYERNRVDDWIAQFARATRAAAQEAVRFSEQINELQHEWLGRFDPPLRKDAIARQIISDLPAFPYITVKIIQDRTGKSNVAALNGLDRLLDAGILTRHRNRKRGDSWEAKELFALLNEFESGVKDPAAASSANE